MEWCFSSQQEIVARHRPTRSPMARSAMLNPSIFSRVSRTGHQRMLCTRRGVKTAHIVARTFFSVLLRRARVSEHFESRPHAWLKMFTGVVCCVVAYLKTPHRTPCFIETLLLTAIDYTYYATADWNQEYTLCDFAGRKSVWLLGRITSSHIFIALELRALETWLVRLVKVSACNK